jgi:hypothetical protein
MYKLLPDANREAIKREYALRRIVIMLVLIALALIFSVLAALPSLIHIEAKKDAATLLSKSSGSISAASDRAELERWAASTKSALLALKPNLGDDPYGLFKSILADKPSGIKIIGLSWQRVSGVLSVRARGLASDRQTLLAFQNVLRSSPLWAEVELPVNTLAADRDIEFELTLRPK